MIKVKTGPTMGEVTQFVDRAKALGLELNNGVIDPASAKNVKGGMAAIQALMKDGALDADGLAQLRQNKGFVAGLLGRDLPISKKQSQGVSATAMEMKGARSHIEKTMREIEFTGKIDNPMLLHANEHLKSVVDNFNKWVTKDDALDLAQVDPKAVKELAGAVEGLAGTMSKYAALLSRFRTAVIDANPTGLWSRMQVGAITDNLLTSLDANRQFQALERALSRPISDLQPSPQAKALQADMDRWG